MNFNFYLPTRVLFGTGKRKQLHRQPMPGRKALIVITGGQSVRKHGYLDEVTAQLEQAGVACSVFDGVSPNPDKEEVEAGVQTLRQEGCDFLVALGGGSVIDAAKAMAAVAANPGDLWDYMGTGTGKKQPLPNAPLPIVAIPTTAGTGSEVNQIAVVTNVTEKLGLFNPGIFPVLAVVDPELMCTVPPTLTAYQGFDALFHCVEGYLSARGNVLTDTLALEGVRHIAAHLEGAVTRGDDLAHRTSVALGSTLAGFVMALGGLTSQHALEHAMSALHHQLPHGAGLIMISRAYFARWAKQPELEERFLALARAMGRAQPAGAMDFVEELDALERRCGMAELSMSDFGITDGELPALVDNALTNMPHSFRNDRVALSAEDCLEIFRDSFR